MSAVVEISQQQIVQRLGKLAEISRIIDVEREDSRFGSEQDGQIIYVFDTNVFQFFLKPITFSRYVELFHTPHWTSDRADFAVNRESALIAGEYLFGGDLPCQKKHKIIISSWHHMELIEQISRLIYESRQTFQSESFVDDVKRGAEHLDDLCRLVKSKNKKLFESLRPKAGTVSEKDLVLLESLGIAQNRRIEIFAVRAICQFLASDLYTEPMEQLRRLLHEVARFDTQESFEDLQISPENQKDFNRAKANWKKQLRAADQAVRLRQRRRLGDAGAEGLKEARTAASIAHDASTLAWLDIISRQLVGSNQRLVFVTGDRVVMNACRRRNADEPLQPFFLRPVQHFAPLLSLNDGGSDLKNIGNPREHFTAMRSAIGQSLALLNLSLDERDDLGRYQPRRVTGRDHFLVNVEEKDGDVFSEYHQGLFELFLNRKWLKEKDTELNEIARPFQEMERLAVSSFSDKVIARVESVTALNLLREWRQNPNTEQDLGTAIESGMKSLLATVTRATMDFTINSVPKFVETLSKEPSKLFERAVYRVRLDLPIEGDEKIPVEDYVRDLARARSTRGTRSAEALAHAERVQARLLYLRDKPALLFCLGIILAFRSERWALASNLAELAAEAAIESATDLQGEIEYIRSVALRYRLASVEPNFRTMADDPWLTLLRAAERSHQVALNIYSQEHHPVRHMRSLSELAAVRLAYLEWAAYGRIDKLKIYKDNIGELRARIEHLLGDVRRGLEHCAVLGETIERSNGGTGTETRQEHAEAISQHWHWNVVVADVTARKLVALGLLAPNTHTPLLTLAVRDQISAARKGHLIYNIYEGLLNASMTHEALARISNGLNRGELTLALDRAVARDLLRTHKFKPA